MRVLIAGAGALGTTYAVLLANAGATVSVLTRPSRVADLRTGLHVTGLVVASANVQVVTSGHEVGAVDYLILTTKVGDSDDVLSACAGATVETALSLQNGLAKNDALDRTYGPDRVIGAACAVVAGREEGRPGVARLTMNRATWVGERRGVPGGARTARLAAVLRASGLPSWSVADGDAIEWYKLCALLPGSLVTALARCSYSDMALNAYLATQFVVLMRETFGVPQSLGIFGVAGTPPIDPPGAPWTFGTWLTGEDAIAYAGLRAIGEAQIAAGQRVLPSMVQDVLGGRTTEVEALVGDFLKRAREAGLALPATETCYRILRGLETAGRR